MNSPISIYALGGLCEVGKNTYCIESDDSLIIIDAGVMFPDADAPGVNYVIPDYSKLKSARQKIKALFITHGHEDHIGGIPFLVQSIHIPVIYAPRLAAALIKRKLVDMRVKEEVNIVEYNDDTIVDLGEFKVSFFHVTHSIPDAYGVVIDTHEGRIVHTGDYKIDLTPVGQQFDLKKLAKIGAEGVDLLLSDSTNAEIEGYTPSESSVLNSIIDIFDGTKGRLILSTFSSNISRIQQVVSVAVSKGRYVSIIGRSMENAVQLAREFGYIKIPDDRLIPVEEIRNHKLSEICILCTGSQGEPMAALSRIANGEHKDLQIYPGDTVIFSSSAIPGNGIMIEEVVNQLTRKGAEVLTNSVLYAVHSSGHPSQQELKLMLKITNPKYFMPIHGEYRMLKIHGQLAKAVGVKKENIFIMHNGDTLTMYKGVVSEGAGFSCNPVYIDGRNINGVSDTIIEDREIMKDDGVVIVTLAINSKESYLADSPKIISRGFIYNDPHLLDNLSKYLDIKIKELIAQKANFNQIKTTVKTVSAQFLFRYTERKPMIIPVIIDKR